MPQVFGETFEFIWRRDTSGFGKALALTKNLFA